jgi:dTDP-4-dehydrorhamnose reductase
MILLLGASGYIGQSFARELERRRWPYLPCSRQEVDYVRFDRCLALLRDRKPELVINAAGYTGRPNVDGCEAAKADTLLGNTLFPLSLAHACLVAGVPWGHVSSGCVYSGAKLERDGRLETVRDLMAPGIRALWEQDRGIVHGFVETDPPNFSFRSPPCSFYSGTKALAEEGITGLGQVYVWRLRIPFDEFDHPRNYLTKLLRYPKVYDNVNSLSHSGDFVRACLDLWQRRAPFGLYNMTNPGFVTARQVTARLREALRLQREFVYWTSDEEFYREAALTPRSNCVLDVSKLLATGVQLRPVEEAIAQSLRDWVAA